MTQSTAGWFHSLVTCLAGEILMPLGSLQPFCPCQAKKEWKQRLSFCLFWNSYMKWPPKKKTIASDLGYQTEQPPNSRVCCEAVQHSLTETTQGVSSYWGIMLPGHQGRNKKGSLVQSWAPGDFRKRAPALKQDQDPSQRQHSSQ